MGKLGGPDELITDCNSTLSYTETSKTPTSTPIICNDVPTVSKLTVEDTRKLLEIRSKNGTRHFDDDFV